MRCTHRVPHHVLLYRKCLNRPRSYGHHSIQYQIPDKVKKIIKRKTAVSVRDYCK